MDGSFHFPLFHYDPLHIQQPVKAAIHGKTRELPFNDPGEPDKGAYVKEPYGPKGFPCFQNLKSSVFKCPFLGFQVQMRKGLFRFWKHHFHKIPVIFTAHLLGDEDTALF